MSNVTRLPISDGHSVHVYPCVFDPRYFVVIVEPDGKYDCLARSFRSYQEAVSYAKGLRSVLGWKFVDETGADVGGAA